MGACFYGESKSTRKIKGKKSLPTFDEKLHPNRKQMSSISLTPTKRIIQFQATSTPIIKHEANHFSTVPVCRNNFVLSDSDYQIGIYGSPDTGKSTFGLKLTKNKLTNYYIPSLFTEMFTINMIIKSKLYSVGITIPQNSEHNSIINANCFLIFFDLSNRPTFEEAKKKISIFFRKRKEPVYLVGNKCDKKQDIPEIEIKRFCRKNKILYFKISSLEGIGLSELMKNIKEKVGKK